jgi:hypothetical protein
MSTAPKPCGRRKPVFGVASLIAPVAGLIIVMCVIPSHVGGPAETGVGYGLEALAIICVAGAAGAASAVVSFIRRECLWAIALAGLLINAYPAFLLLSNLRRQW